METKTITVPDASNWREGKSTITLVKRWCMVHAKTGQLAINVQGRETHATLKECQAACDNLVKNNPADKVARFYPTGVRPAAWWCYEHFDLHSSAEPFTTVIQIKKFPKGYNWNIYGEWDKVVWMRNEPAQTIDELKAEVLEMFPDAIFEEVK